MIERINSEMMVIRPNQGTEKGLKNVGIRVGSESVKPADYLYNPNLADKISASRDSIREEMSLLREAGFMARSRSRDDEPGNDSKTTSLSLDVLRRSLARIKSLLYQVASVAAADPDSIEALQRKLADELRGYERIFETVRLAEFEKPELQLDAMRLGGESGKIDADAVNPESASDTIELVSSAEQVVERMLEGMEEVGSEQSRAEAVLSTTDQNLAAAESAFYPQEIMSRAKEASFSLRDRMLDVFPAQAHLEPDQVYGLTSSG